MALTDLVEDNKTMYLSVLEGSFRQKVSEGTPKAIRREYIIDEETKGEKWEIRHRRLTGIVKRIEFEDGKYGQQCMITVQNGEEIAILYIPTYSRYFVDLAKKLLSAQLSQEVSLTPFDFKSDAGKQITGITVMQGGAKMQSRYWDGVRSINGAPAITGDSSAYTTEDWKAFFLAEREFLIDEMTEFALCIENPTQKVAHYMSMDEILPSKPKPVAVAKPTAPKPNLDKPNLGIEGKI